MAPVVDHVQAEREVLRAGTGQTALLVNLWLEEASTPNNGAQALPVTRGSKPTCLYTCHVH